MRELDLKLDGYNKSIISLKNIDYTDNYYSVILCDKEINRLRDFLNKFIMNNYE